MVLLFESWLLLCGIMVPLFCLGMSCMWNLVEPWWWYHWYLCTPVLDSGAMLGLVTCAQNQLLTLWNYTAHVLCDIR